MEQDSFEVESSQRNAMARSKARTAQECECARKVELGVVILAGLGDIYRQKYGSIYTGVKSFGCQSCPRGRTQLSQEPQILKWQIFIFLRLMVNVHFWTINGYYYYFTLARNIYEIKNSRTFF